MSLRELALLDGTRPLPLGEVIGIIKKNPCNRLSRPCEISRLPNRLTDGIKVSSHIHWVPFTHRKISWYSFLLEAELQRE
jgi:hypothetical protein